VKLVLHYHGRGRFTKVAEASRQSCLERFAASFRVARIVRDELRRIVAGTVIHLVLPGLLLLARHRRIRSIGIIGGTLRDPVLVTV